MDEWLSKITGFITSFTEFLDNKKDEDLIGYLKGGSGIFAIAFGVAQMISDYKKSQGTKQELSILDLFYFLFSFTADQIKTIIKEKNVGSDLSFTDFKELKKELKTLFSIYEKGISPDTKIESPWLPLHPLIQKFKNETLKWLSNYNQNVDIIKEFDRNFEDRIEYDLYNNNNLEPFRQIARQKLYEDKLMKYLDFLIQDYNNFINGQNNYLSPLSIFQKSYVEDRKGIILDIKEEWNQTDSNIYLYSSDKIQNIDTILENFLNINDRKEPLFIGASYGLGKTTLMRKLVYECAKKRNKMAGAYIPIIIYLKNGLNFQWEKSREPIEDFLETLFKKEYDSNTNIDKPILLIFDALDEFYDLDKYSIFDLITDKQKNFKKFSNIRKIYTARLNKEFEKLSEINDEYVRLLPFDTNQVEFFLRQKKSELTYQELISRYYLDEEAIKKPLILSILVDSFPNIKDDFIRLHEKNKLTVNLTKTLVYMQMFYDHYYGKLRKISEKDYINKIGISYQKERQILRLISYYKQIKEDLTLEDLEIWSEYNNQEISNLQPIINTYFRFSKKDKYINKKSNIMINYLHKTYEEFLLAEYLIEQFIKGKSLNLLIGKPSEVTINFFKGFLDLFNSDNETINKFVINKENSKNTLAFSLNYKPKLTQDELIDYMVKKILNNAKQFFKDNSITLLDIDYYDEQKDENKKVESTLREVKGIISEINSYKNLWIHRWISVMVLGYLNGNYIKELEGNKLIELIKYSSHNVPHYVKYLSFANILEDDKFKTDLSQVNLSHADLSNARIYTDLSNANLTGANLSGANLSGANLSGANLSGANLSGANFFDDGIFAILSHTNLSGANLAYANLFETNLFNANLYRADLSYANLSYANLSHANLSTNELNHSSIFPSYSFEEVFDMKTLYLSYTNFSHAILSYVNLSGADLSKTDLSNVNLVGADLSKTDLSNVNLVGVNLSGANLSNAVLSGADFKNTIIIDPHFSPTTISWKTDFQNAIIDDSKFIDHISKFTDKVPEKIENKRELKIKLKHAGVNGSEIIEFLKISKLPE